VPDLHHRHEHPANASAADRPSGDRTM
jgi:hypothetical protein